MTHNDQNLCLADVAGYGACIREPHGDDPLHRDANGYTFTARDTFTIYAEDGEYAETATDIGTALTQFRARRPDLFVSAVVNDGMRPRLVVADDAEPIAVAECEYCKHTVMRDQMRNIDGPRSGSGLICKDAAACDQRDADRSSVNNNR